jgi:hypothetical protein
MPKKINEISSLLNPTVLGLYTVGDGSTEILEKRNRFAFHISEIITILNLSYNYQ